VYSQEKQNLSALTALAKPFTFYVFTLCNIWISHLYVFTKILVYQIHCVPKNILTIFDCNWKTNYQI